MIKYIKIKNFQSHASTEFEFHEGVTAIVGPSDCGKSAIIRALRWLLFNDQPGEAYRTHGSKETSVTVAIPAEAPEGWAQEGRPNYSRVRSNKDNKYVVDNGGLDRNLIEFDKVKNDVPEELRKAFNMDGINVQKQLDPHFLLSESPAEVGRVLNRAAGIDDIDTCMTAVNSMERENSKDLSTRTADLKDLDAELSKYRRLSDVDAKVSAAEKVDQLLKRDRAQVSDLENILESMEGVEEKIEQLDPLAAVSLDEVESLQDKCKGMKRQIRDISDDIDVLEVIGVKADNTSIEPLHISIQEALKDSEGLVKAEKVIDSLEKCLDDIENSEGDYKDKKKRYVSLVKEFEELMPETCPLCEHAT